MLNHYYWDTPKIVMSPTKLQTQIIHVIIYSFLIYAGVHEWFDLYWNTQLQNIDNFLRPAVFILTLIIFVVLCLLILVKSNYSTANITKISPVNVTMNIILLITLISNADYIFAIIIAFNGITSALINKHLTKRYYDEGHA